MIPRSGALERLLGRDGERVDEEGRTILLTHGERRPRAVLLFHGITAVPMQFRRYADALYARGFNVLVPRLPRHGYRDRMTGALARLTVDGLCDFALESLEAARSLGEDVTVAGVSAGGTLALWLAQRAPLDRAVAIAPFLGVALVPRAIMRVVAAAMLLLPNRFVWWNPIKREHQMPERGYPRYATHAIARVYEIASSVLQNATRAPCAREIVLIVNGGEATVNNGEMRALFRRWRATGANVAQLELRGMPPSHDIIETERNVELAKRVFPTILDAIDPQR